jgi:DNA polymerase-3 subunit delta'
MPPITLHTLLEQPAVSEFLRSTVAQARFGNAYLFEGPPGVGKGSAAIAFARAILCEKAGSAGASGGGLFDAPAEPVEASKDDACGTCATCLKTAALQHPDLRFLFPVSGEEKELDNTIAETVERWREDPFFVFEYEKAASIRISMTRELLRELGYRTFEAARRVVVLRDADRMREDQYSALLKRLEEPGAATVWVLTTSRPARLPATIRSRCQRVKFAPLAERVVTAFLEERAGTGNQEARMLAALGGGSLARALSLRGMEPLKLRNDALALLEPAFRGDAAGLLRAVQQMSRFGKAGRETLRRMIEFHELWLRDILRARHGAPREALVHRDREAEIRKQAVSLDAREIRRRLALLEEALRSIEGNVTPDLALFSAMARIADPTLARRAEFPAPATPHWDY